MIAVQNSQKRLSINVKSVENTVRRILKLRKIQESDLTLVFVSRQKMTALNRKYLQHNYATDTLTFDLRLHPKDILRGDIVISADAVIKQAKMFGQPVNRELTLYVVHGILHLLGYDDHSPDDIQRMRAEEQRILNLLT